MQAQPLMAHSGHIFDQTF